MPWRHKKTGGLYTLQYRAFWEKDQAPVIVYQAHSDGKVWVRPEAEFYERFECVETPKKEVPRCRP